MAIRPGEGLPIGGSGAEANRISEGLTRIINATRHAAPGHTAVQLTPKSGDLPLGGSIHLTGVKVSGIDGADSSGLDFHYTFSGTSRRGTAETQTGTVSLRKRPDTPAWLIGSTVLHEDGRLAPGLEPEPYRPLIEACGARVHPLDMVGIVREATAEVLGGTVFTAQPTTYRG